MGEPTITFAALYTRASRFRAVRIRPPAKIDILSREGIVVPTGGFVKVKTGVAAVIPNGCEIRVRPCSGLVAKSGVRARFGTVDIGCQGEICMTLLNASSRPCVAEKGERIAQLVLRHVKRSELP